MEIQTPYGFYFVDVGDGNQHQTGYGVYVLSTALPSGEYYPTTETITLVGGLPSIGGPTDLYPTSESLELSCGTPGLYNPQGGSAVRRGVFLSPLGRYGNTQFWMLDAPSTSFTEDTALSLVSSASALSSAMGQLIMAIDLSGLAEAEATATGDLSPHPLAGSAQAVSTAAGALATLINLAANAESEAGATGNPDVLVAIAGAASALAAASATLGQAALLHGDAAAIAIAAAGIAMELGLSGDAAARVTAAGQLSSVSNLASAAQAVATVAGALDQSLAVAGAAQAVATVAGDLSQVIEMSSAAAAQASATGALDKAETVTGGLVYAVNLTTGAVTTLSNFYFERLIRAHGRTYGLLAGTLYRIEGTVDPGDAPISVSIRTGSIPPKADVLRRLDKVYLHARERAGITMTPIYDEVQGRTHYPKPGIRDGMIVHRTNIGINNRWHTLGLQITNIDGGTLDIGGLEILTEPLTRRIT